MKVRMLLQIVIVFILAIYADVSPAKGRKKKSKMKVKKVEVVKTPERLCHEAVQASLSPESGEFHIKSLEIRPMLYALPGTNVKKVGRKWKQVDGIYLVTPGGLHFVSYPSEKKLAQGDTFRVRFGKKGEVWISFGLVEGKMVYKAIEPTEKFHSVKAQWIGITKKGLIKGLNGFYAHAFHYIQRAMEDKVFLKERIGKYEEELAQARVKLEEKFDQVIEQYGQQQRDLDRLMQKIEKEIARLEESSQVVVGKMAEVGREPASELKDALEVERLAYEIQLKRIQLAQTQYKKSLSHLYVVKLGAEKGALAGMEPEVVKFFEKFQNVKATKQFEEELMKLRESFQVDEEVKGLEDLKRVYEEKKLRLAELKFRLDNPYYAKSFPEVAQSLLDPFEKGACRHIKKDLVVLQELKSELARIQ